VGVEEGSSVPIHYDPMLGKLIVSGTDRATAIVRLSRALSEYEISGVQTTLPLFRAFVEDPAFHGAEFDTQWLDEWLAGRSLEPPEAGVDEAILGATSLAVDGGTRISAPSGAGSRWRAAARDEALRVPLRGSGRPRP
jgi:acetyl/propionyl-CoA carboxylase alpha subunit